MAYPWKALSLVLILVLSGPFARAGSPKPETTTAADAPADDGTESMFASKDASPASGPLTAELKAVVKGTTEWLQDAAFSGERQAMLKKLRQDYPDTSFRFHLLDTTPVKMSEDASPPAARGSIPESKGILILIISPKERSFRDFYSDLSVSTDVCADPVQLRVLMGGKDGALGHINFGYAKKDEFQFEPVGEVFSCAAGKASYTLAGKVAESDTRLATRICLRLRPVFYFAPMVVFGYDGTRNPSFSTVSGKIARFDDYYGPNFLAGITWFPAGLDLEESSWTSNLINPFIGVDLKNPMNKFVIGTALFPRSVAALNLGASFQPGLELKGIKEGDPYGAGEIPTRLSWERPAVGVFVGLSFYSDLAGMAKSLFLKN